jgi:hypothetical protein
VGLSELVERMAREADPTAIARAREAFEARTGAFAVGEPFYEERIAAFFDFALATFEGGALTRAFARRPEIGDDDHAIASAILRAERSVFRVDRTDAGLVCESLFGARYRIAATGVAARLLGGERFDGRLVSVGGSVEVMPGAIFHPAETHEALDHLFAEIGTRGLPARVSTQQDLADALLRMRMRFDRFTSIQARHVYRWDALERMEILAASWARPEGRAR